MRILAIDFGEKRLGVAVSCPLKIISQAVECIERKGMKEDIEKIKCLVDKYEVEEILFGLPLRTSGEENIEAKRVRDFANIVRKHITAKINFWDERYTTSSAHKILLLFPRMKKNKRKVIDKTAAAIILQSYLDSKTQ